MNVVFLVGKYIRYLIWPIFNFKRGRWKSFKNKFFCEEQVSVNTGALMERKFTMEGIMPISDINLKNRLSQETPKLIEFSEQVFQISDCLSVCISSNFTRKAGKVNVKVIGILEKTSSSNLLSSL